MRRLAVLTLAAAAATAAVLGATTAPAWAHICPIAAQIPVAQAATIDVGVTVEGAAVSDVEIDLPPGLSLDRVDAKPGWTFARSGSTVRYHGGPIPAFTCAYFSLGVTAPQQGGFGVGVVQRTADGTVVARAVPDPTSPSDRVLDQFVYAGVKPPATPGTSKGVSAPTIAGVALVALGVAMFALLRFRRWREGSVDDDEDGDTDEGGGEGVDGADREAQLRARLERFKARTADRPLPH